MLDVEPQTSTGVDGRHLVLFDGVCGLCSRLVQFVLAHDRRQVFSFASLQSSVGRAAVARAGGNPEELTTLYVFANYREPEGRLLTKSRGAIFVLNVLGWPWKAGGLTGVLLPTRWLDRLYEFVARHRYRAFGRDESCLMPRPEYRNRFLD
jgi:predicted DCC family thiol-disulfide oxidoreductase YuxK